MVAVYIDVETYSEVDLTKVGTPVYAAHPSTELLVLSWAVEDGPIETWEPRLAPNMPESLIGLIKAPGCNFHAHNMAFESAIFEHVLGTPIPLERQRCDMVHGLSLGLPASLAQMGSAIGIPAQKAKLINGKRLIRKFCQPRKPTKARPWSRCDWDTDPEEWEAFVEYNQQDVVAERAIYNRLKKWPMSELEWRYWRLDQRINGAGFPIDRQLVTKALEQAAQTRQRLVEEAKTLTGLDNPNSVPQLIGWLKSQGVKTDTLDKHRVQVLLDEGQAEEVQRVLEIRQQLGKGSLAKFNALERATSADHRLRNCLQFYGAARTGRWAGRVFQPQNLPRGDIKDVDELRALVEHVREGGEVDMEQLSNCIRSAVRAPEGQRVRVADLANIESRVLAWISNCKRMLRVFANGGDPYADFGTALFNCPLDQIDKERRNYSKPPTLGCGYGLGAKGLVAYADGMFVPMTLEEAQVAVNIYRDTYPEVVRLWRLLEQATMKLVEQRCGRATVGRLVFEFDAPFLFMVLPSGRKLAYLHPRVEKKLAPWGDYVDNVTYMGMDQYTRKWTRLSTFGGKWVEQACQAIARDVQACGLDQADQLGFEIVGHTHDELIALTDEDDWRDEEVLSWCMYQPPEWADEHLYLDAEGFSDVIYRKD